jgi:hypothetical protein
MVTPNGGDKSISTASFRPIGIYPKIFNEELI